MVRRANYFRCHARTDAGRAAVDHPPVRPGRAVLRPQGDRDRRRRRAASASPTATGPTAPGASAACSTRSASPADGRVATFAWNTARHLELYFAAPCTGRVLHTLNIRLFPEQLTYIVNHADDEVIFVDRSLLALLAPLLPTFERLRHLVLMDDGNGEVPDADALAGHELLDYEDAARRRRRRSSSPSTTRTRRRACATRAAPPATPRASSTATAARSCTRWAAMTADSLGVRESDRVLPVVPMFHANAWGLAHAGVAAGADLVMPGPDLSGKALADLDRRGAGHASPPACRRSGCRCCPSSQGRDTSSLRAIPCGGSAVPKALSEAYREQLGLPILQAWGMTETSPVASVVPPRRRPGAAARRASRPSCAPASGAATVRRRVPRRRARQRRRRCRRDGRVERRAAVPRAVDRGDLLRRPARRRELHRRRLAAHRRRGDDGRARAGSASSTAPRTSSSRAASGSRRSSWRTS